MRWFFNAKKKVKVMTNKIVIFVIFAALLISMKANAQLNIFTDHQVVSMITHGVNSNDDVQFPTGDYPYLGRIGLEYQRKNWAYQLSFIHRSNVDLWGQDEYNYNGVSVGIKYSHCISRC